MPKKYILLTLFLFSILSQNILSGQSQKATTLELQGAVGFVNLLVKNSGGTRVDFSQLYKQTREAEGFLGYSVQLSILGNRQISRSLWLKSGGQLQYLRGRYDFRNASSFINLPSDLIEESENPVESSFYTFQIPLLLECQKPLKSAKLYAQLGLSVAFSYVFQKYKARGISYYTYTTEYSNACNCTIVDERFLLNPPEEYSFDYKEEVPQHELKGMLGVVYRMWR